MAQKQQSWSKTGKTSLKKKQGFNWKKYLPIVAVITLVGGFFVWRSFASTNFKQVDLAYQHSAYQCAGFDVTKINQDDKCVKESAEAATFRLYQGILNRNPDGAGYKYWVQKLAGDRQQPTDMATELLKKAPLAKAANADYTPTLYTNMTEKTLSKTAKTDWQKRLDSKKWSKPQTAAYLMATADAQNTAKLKAAFVTYLSKAPKVAVVDTAKNNWLKQSVEVAQLTNTAQAKYNNVKGLPATSRSNRNTAAQSAQKNPPSPSDLQAIKGNSDTVKSNLTKANSALSDIKNAEKSAKAIYVKANSTASYAKDLSAADIKAKYDKIVSLRKDTETNIVGGANAGLTKLLNEIAASYSTAESKYQASIAPPPSSGGGGSDGGSGGGQGSAAPSKSPLRQASCVGLVHNTELIWHGNYAGCANPDIKTHGGGDVAWNYPTTGSCPDRGGHTYVQHKHPYGQNGENWQGIRCNRND